MVAVMVYRLRQIFYLLQNFFSCIARINYIILYLVEQGRLKMAATAMRVVERMFGRHVGDGFPNLYR